MEPESVFAPWLVTHSGKQRKNFAKTLPTPRHQANPGTERRRGQSWSHNQIFQGAGPQCLACVRNLLSQLSDLQSLAVKGLSKPGIELITRVLWSYDGRGLYMKEANSRLEEVEMIRPMAYDMKFTWNTSVNVWLKLTFPECFQRAVSALCV